MRKTVAILGIPIDDLTTMQVIDRLHEFIQARRFHQVATANTDFLIRAQTDPELKTILRTADLVVPDGMPLVWASRWLRAGLRERVTGADLVPLLAAFSAASGYRIFMLGGEPASALAARRSLENTYPGVQIVGCESPDIPNLVTADHEALLRRIEAAHPDILLVAFGNPKQEKWIHMHRQRLTTPVCIGVGGTFDFLSGKSRRAPRLLQRLGLEFAHRWRQDPQRLGSRYRRNLLRFPPLIARQLRSMRRGMPDAEPRITEFCTEDCTVLSVEGSLGTRGLWLFQIRADRALNMLTHLVVDLQPTTQIDSAALGTLLNLRKRAAWVGCEVRLVGPNERIRQIFHLSDAEMLFQTYPTVADALCARQKTRFDVCLSVQERETVLQMCGRADVEETSRVEETLVQIPDSARPLLLDLCDVNYIDCGMLAVLYRYADNRKRAGLPTRLVASEAVTEALFRENLDGLCYDIPGSSRAA